MDNVTQIDFNIAQLRPYINWLYFYHAWGLAGKPQSEKDKLLNEANAMLDHLQLRYQTHALVGLFDANADGDDIVVGTERMPMLRQQRPSAPGAPYLCLADFVRPLSSGIKDRVGVFAASIDEAIEHDFQQDDFQRMLAQTLADRLAEATAELVHLQVRRTIWGYAPDENLSVAELLREDFQGIRPAVGYPSLPQLKLIFPVSKLLNFDTLNMRLTENGAMYPQSTVCGLYLSNPQAKYLWFKQH